MTLCTADTVAGISWGPDGIVFGQGIKGIMRISPNGGKPETLATAMNGEITIDPEVLPGAQAVMFTVAPAGSTQWDKAQIVVQSLNSNKRKTIIQTGIDAHYLPTGDIVYSANRALFSTPFDLRRLEAAGGPVPVLEVFYSQSDIAHFPDSWAPDGQRFSYTAEKGNTASVWVYSLKDQKATLFAEAPDSFLGWSVFSPDGHWIAYQSNETQKLFQVGVQPFPSTGAKQQVSRDGALSPLWSPNRKELFYTSSRVGIVGVNVVTQPSFTFGTPSPAARFANLVRFSLPRNFDITPDGKLLGTVPSNQSGLPPAGSQIQVVLNWFEDVKQKMSSK
jgi:dipeptidyl aminopeptidase/acylaminoacyl peptidase